MPEPDERPVPQTADEILAFIRDNSKPGDWKLTSFGIGKDCVRHASGECPICWLGSQLGRNRHKRLNLAVSVGAELGLKYFTTADIVAAADDGTGGSPELRQKLLTACYLA